MYQRVTVVGHLGADPEMRYTASGVPVTNFRIATTRRWTNAQGEQQEKTTWFRVAAWRQLAETCNQYLAKGRMVLVEGEIDVSTWKDSSGEPRASLEITARTVRFLGGPREERAAAPPFEASEEGVPEEEIPF
jgi:single-strand DNA-binding protein